MAHKYWLITLGITLLICLTLGVFDVGRWYTYNGSATVSITTLNGLISDAPGGITVLGVNSSDPTMTDIQYSFNYQGFLPDLNGDIQPDTYVNFATYILYVMAALMIVTGVVLEVFFEFNQK